TSIRGAITGKGGDVNVIDDPHDIRNIEADTYRPATAEWWDNVWSTRSNDPAVTPHVIIMQRSHVEDLAGHVLRKADTAKWTRLDLAMEFPKTYSLPPNRIGWKNPHEEEGSIRWPSRFTPAVVAGIKATTIFRVTPRNTSNAHGARTAAS